MTGSQILRTGRVGLVVGLMSITGLLGRAQTPSVTVQATVQVYSGAGANGPANLVSNAVPFKPGALQSASDLRVLSGGTEVPVAVQVLASWPSDGSIRSLLVQFDAPAAGAYTIEIGAPRTRADRTFVPVTWDVPTRIFTLPASYLSASFIF